MVLGKARNLSELLLRSKSKGNNGYENNFLIVVSKSMLIIFIVLIFLLEAE